LYELRLYPPGTEVPKRQFLAQVKNPKVFVIAGMAVSLRFIPRSTIRWRERRFVVVDYAGMDAIVAREAGKRRLFGPETSFTHCLWCKARLAGQNALANKRPVNDEKRIYFAGAST
jgi:hypothetical protein